MFDRKLFAWYPTKLACGKRVWLQFYWEIWSEVETHGNRIGVCHDIYRLSRDEYIKYKLSKGW